MKVYEDCAPCMIRRVYESACQISDSQTVFKCMKAVFKLMSRGFYKNTSPSWLGTLQSELVQKITKNKDPFSEKKLFAIKNANKYSDEFKKYISEEKEPFERFRKAILVAICGNTIEVSAPHHKININNIREELEKGIKDGFEIDHTKKIFERIKGAKRILYICDNAGEAVFDKLLIEEIKKYAKVVIAVASGPINDDITIKEAKLIGLDKVAPIIGKGKCFGIWKKRANKRFWKELKNIDFIVAKGMGCYETLTEYSYITKGKSALLFRVKCSAVAKDVGAKIGSNIALLL